MDQKSYDKAIPHFQVRLEELQRECRSRDIPVIIMIEGWNASGITQVTRELIQHLDPRGYNFWSMGNPSDLEAAHPFMWRFWIKTPGKGRIAIFAHSWYSRAIAERVTGVEWKKNLKLTSSWISSFERQLTIGGTVIVKIFLHISKDEQHRRLLEREQDLLTSWLVSRGDWVYHHDYELYCSIVESLIQETDTSSAPWTIIEATDPLYRNHKVFSTVIRQIEGAVRAHDALVGKRVSGKVRKPWQPGKKHKIDLSASLSHEEYENSLPSCQKRVHDLQYILWKRRIPFIILFEGWDAAGKGGNILRLTRKLNPRSCEVVPVGKPNDIESRYHYLWRFYQKFPYSGHLTIFDRSWYGRVLVERVEGFCSADEWERAYEEINEMEEMFVENGGGIAKFWLEIDPAVQLERFSQRESDPRKHWKITEEDWRNREKWEDYRIAVDEMLDRTSTSKAPWTIIESNDKYYARIKTLKTVIQSFEAML